MPLTAISVLTVLTVLVAFALSVFAVRVFIDWLVRRAFVAEENERTMHKGRIPQGGGAPVLAVTLAVGLGLWPWSVWHTALIPGVVGLAILSAVDDRRGVPALVRLAAHGAAAAWLLTMMPAEIRLLDGWVPVAVERAVLLVAVMWFMNLYNFMDGIDGITGVETISIAIGTLAVLTVAGAATPLDGLALALIGATAGFLVWNWHPARIFLGDVGSVPIGLVCAALLIHLAATTSLAAAIILPLYYAVDATGTLLRRALRGEKIWRPHRVHAYQRAARGLGSHSIVVRWIASCNAVLGLAAVGALWAPVPALAVAVVSVAVLMFALERAAAQESAPLPALPRPTPRIAVVSIDDAAA